jgi:hypothetical protein
MLPKRPVNALSFIAVRVGQKTPANYRKTGEHVVCPQCGATFSIARLELWVDQKLIADQIEGLQELIADGHDDHKFADHCAAYQID